MATDVSSGRVRRPWLLTLLVVAFAAVVRFSYLDWDQSHHFHPDERAIAEAVTKIRLDPRTPRLDPEFFAYGSLPFYLVRAAVDIGALFTDRARGYDQIILIGRGVSAALGVLSVYCLILFARRLYNDRIALLAGFLLAAAPLHVQNSHFMTTDVAVSLTAFLALMALVTLVERGKLQHYVWAGIAIGAAVATKFSAMPLFAPLGVAVLLRLIQDRRPGKAALGSAMALLAAIVAFAIGEPYAFKTFHPITIAASLFTFLVKVWSEGWSAWEAFLREVAWDRYAASIREQSHMVRNPGAMPYTNQYIGTPRYLYELKQIVLWGMAPPLGIAALLGTAHRIVTFRRERWQAHVVLLSYVIPYFLITGWFGVKFPRYMLPLYPLLILWGAALLWKLARASRLGRMATWIVCAGTFAALMALMSVYQRPHTVVTASQWVYKHIPAGSMILGQHWDEGFPFHLPGNPPSKFKLKEIPYYEPDTPQKIRAMARDLAAADYIAFQTTRLYGAITMAPEKYPLTSNYFYLLFAGDLGYTLLWDHDARPRLFGIEFKDELADESLTVYDHPKVLIFKNERRLPAEEIEDKILRGSPSKRLTREDLLVAEAGDRGILAGAEQTPPTRSSWSALLRCALIVELLGLAAYFVVQRWLPVPGAYAIGKVLGILAFAYFPWLLTHWQITTFTRSTLAVTFLLMLGWGAWARRGRRFGPARAEWIPVELLFWFSFLFFLGVRAYNPEVFWGEKPMDFSFLNALNRATTLPPPEPWCAGYTLHYSYFGHYVVAALGKLGNIHPGVTFNLGISLFGALVAVGAFAAGCAISDRWSVGILAALLSTLFGNLAGVRELVFRSRIDGPGLMNSIGDVFRAMGFDYFWATSRVIKDTINEYPLWTFLFADLHAHALVLPFSLVFVALTVWWVRRDEPGVELSRPALVLLLGFFLGAIMVTNTWSSFTYVPFFPFVLGCAWFVRRRIGFGRVLAALLPLVLLTPYSTVERRLPELAPHVQFVNTPAYSYAKWLVVAFLVLQMPGVLLPTAAILALAGLFYFPYWQQFFDRRDVQSVNNWGFQGPGDSFAHFYDFANIFGLFLWAAIPFLFVLWARQIRGPLRDRLPPLPKAILWIVGVAIAACFALTIPWGMFGDPEELRTFLHIGALNAQDPDHRYAVVGSVRYGLGCLAILALHLALQKTADGMWQRIAIFLSFVFFVTAGVDVVYVWDRMNTVFKFYLESWLLFSIAAAAAVSQLWGWMIRSRPWRRVWRAGFVALVLVSLFTAASITRGVIVTRRVQTPRPTLDGTAYLALRDPHEAAAFEWLNREVLGIPVLAEAWGPSYQDYTRVAMNTGLPVVLGWDYHVHQRDVPNAIVARRKEDLRKLYTSEKRREVEAVLQRYNVALVYVGPMERKAYAGGNLARFREWKDLLTPVYENKNVTIFGVAGQFRGAVPVTTIEQVAQERDEEGEVVAQAGPGELRQPRAAAVDLDGNVYVADFDNHRIQKFNQELDFVTMWGEQGSAPGQFKQPCDVAIGPDGNVYVADTWNQRIQVFNADGEYQREWGGAFFGPRGIAVSKDGKVYLADTGNHRVRRFSLEGQEELTWGGNGSLPGQFKEPYGIAVDLAGNVYVCDNLNARLQIFDANGKFQREFPVEGWKGVVFSEPKVAITPDGNIWVTVPELRVVRAYDRNGKLLRQIHGRQYPGAQFEKPLGLAYSRVTNELIVTDLENRVVRLPLPGE